MNTATPAREPLVDNTAQARTNGPVRIGVLGAARIAPGALIRPAASNPEVEVVAVAARDRERAQRFAARHQLAKVGPSPTPCCAVSHQPPTWTMP